MNLPDGYSDVPAGKIAAVVTHLEMTERPASPGDPEGAWSLRRVNVPDLDWYRDLYRRIGEEWLWSSRIRMPDAQLAVIVQSPLEEVYALVLDGRDEGLLEPDFRIAGQCPGGQSQTGHSTRWPRPGEPGGRDWLLARDEREG
jgi:hypothetical protein